MTYWRPFNATNEPGTCLWCGNRLRVHYYSDAVRETDTSQPPRRCECRDPRGPRFERVEDADGLVWECQNCGHRTAGRHVTRYENRHRASGQLGDGPGDYGDGCFCGLRCGMQFAVAFAIAGRRLRPAITAGLTTDRSKASDRGERKGGS